jgi:hypothetical protein
LFFSGLLKEVLSFRFAEEVQSELFDGVDDLLVEGIELLVGYILTCTLAVGLTFAEFVAFVLLIFGLLLDFLLLQLLDELPCLLCESAEIVGHCGVLFLGEAALWGAEAECSGLEAVIFPLCFVFFLFLFLLDFIDFELVQLLPAFLPAHLLVVHEIHVVFGSFPDDPTHECP